MFHSYSPAWRPFSLLLLLCRPAAAADTLTPEQARRDADILVKTLRALHPALDKYRTPAEVDAAFARFQARGGAARTPAAMYLAATELAASIRCGHTWTNVLNQQGAIKTAPARRRRQAAADHDPGRGPLPGAGQRHTRCPRRRRSAEHRRPRRRPGGGRHAALSARRRQQRRQAPAPAGPRPPRLQHDGHRLAAAVAAGRRRVPADHPTARRRAQRRCRRHHPGGAHGQPEGAGRRTERRKPGPCASTAPPP